MDVPTIQTECKSCGGSFEQPDDPGRRRVYCGNACRQRDYRARQKVTAQEQSQARERAERAERERAEQERQERQRRRQEQRRRQQSYGSSSDWWSPRTTDNASQAKARATCARLMERAEHPKTNAHEAQACRAKADAMRSKRGL